MQQIEDGAQQSASWTNRPVEAFAWTFFLGCYRLECMGLYPKKLTDSVLPRVRAWSIAEEIRRT
jgi:hypothetical protein